MNRGWTWITEPDEEQQELLKPLLDSLAQEWSSMTTAREQRGWARLNDLESGYSDEPEFDTDEEYEEFKLTQRQNAQREQLRLELIEAQLAHLGARMMRPYEHWNEDERWMEYSERDR